MLVGWSSDFAMGLCGEEMRYSWGSFCFLLTVVLAHAELMNATTKREHKVGEAGSPNYNKRTFSRMLKLNPRGYRWYMRRTYQSNEHLITQFHVS